MQTSAGWPRMRRGAGELGKQCMWQDILTAFALYLIIEGMIPFVSPSSFRKTVARIAKLGDNNLRMAGLVAMGAGLLVLYLVRS